MGVSQLRIRSTPARRLRLKPSFPAVQERAVSSTIIPFDGLLVIVGGGAVDHDLLRDLYVSGGHLVGADGGADEIVAAGLTPEVIIGDFDSLKNVDGWLGRTRLLLIPEQET